MILVTQSLFVQLIWEGQQEDRLTAQIVVARKFLPVYIQSIFGYVST